MRVMPRGGQPSEELRGRKTMKGCFRHGEEGAQPTTKKSLHGTWHRRFANESASLSFRRRATREFISCP